MHAEKKIAELFFARIGTDINAYFRQKKKAMHLHFIGLWQLTGAAAHAGLDGFKIILTLGRQAS